jgi:hypothetical protein
MGYGARVPVGAHGCCGCGVAPPSGPLRFCSDLTYNSLTGSVPSSLSALTNLAFLYVPPSCQRRLRVRPRRVGLVGSAPSGAACRGMHVGGIEQGRCGSRAVAVVSEGTSGMRCDYYEVLKGHPSHGVRCAGTGRGTWLLWVRRSTVERPSPLRVSESASGVQQTQPERADGECAELALRAHKAFIPVRASCLPTALACAAEDVRTGRLCSEQHGMSGDACRGHRAGAVRQQGRCGTLRGDLGYAM